MRKYSRPAVAVMDVCSEERIAACRQWASWVNVPGNGPSQSVIDELINNNEFFTMGFACKFEWVEVSTS